MFQNDLKKTQDTQQESNQTNQKDGAEPETVDQRIAKLKTKVKGRYIQIIVLILSLSFNPLPNSLGLLCFKNDLGAHVSLNFIKPVKEKL